MHGGGEGAHPIRDLLKIAISPAHSHTHESNKNRKEVHAPPPKANTATLATSFPFLLVFLYIVAGRGFACIDGNETLIFFAYIIPCCHAALKGKMYTRLRIYLVPNLNFVLFHC